VGRAEARYHRFERWLGRQGNFVGEFGEAEGQIHDRCFAFSLLLYDETGSGHKRCKIADPRC
jgi:hypothetical protein